MQSARTALLALSFSLSAAFAAIPQAQLARPGGLPFPSPPPSGQGAAGTAGAGGQAHAARTGHQPSADFSASPLSGVAPLSVDFVDGSEGRITSWSWDFGDGTGSSDPNPTRLYEDPGTYSVSLTVIGNGGSDMETKVDYVTVLEPPPIADFSATPLAGLLPLEVSFTDESQGAVTSWLWEFGDGGTSGDPSPMHTYTDPGDYTVTLTVSGPGGMDAETKVDHISVDAPVPVITTDLPEMLIQGEDVTFTVTVTDPNGHNVSLRLLNPAVGMLFLPLDDVPSPATATIRWQIILSTTHQPPLIFEAFNSMWPGEKARKAVPTNVEHVVQGCNCNPRLGEYTGDDTLDVLFSGFPGSTAATMVFEGGPNPGGAPRAFTTVGSRHHDVTGDGILDLIMLEQPLPTEGLPDILVYAGGSSLTGSPAPTATLQDGFGFQGDTSTQLFFDDVTGDGIDDVIACAPDTTLCNDPYYCYDAIYLGAIWVFAGGPSMVGTLTQTALLATTPEDAVSLGDTKSPFVHLADMTGDGLLDVITGAKRTSLGGVSETGAYYLWEGGSGLIGTVEPVILAPPGAAAEDRLGAGGGGAIGSQTRIADVTGDGMVDLLVANARTDVGGVTDAGAIHIWAGGSVFSGTTAPTVTLTVPGAGDEDFLGGTDGPSITLADVTGDGQIDVLSGAPGADVGATDGGAIYVWEGGAGITTASAPDATFSLPDPKDDLFYYPLTSQLTWTIYTADLSGDGILDVIVPHGTADIGGVTDAGRVYMWKGAAGLSGTVSPHAIFELPVKAAGDGFARGTPGHPVTLRDLTGDGTADLLAGSLNVNWGGLSDTGVFALWAGGPGLSGLPAPTAILEIPNASGGDGLGLNLGPGGGDFYRAQAAQTGDVTGDGLLDVIIPASYYDDGATQEAGALFVWSGGAGLTGTPAPLATLINPDGGAFDYLGAGDHGNPQPTFLTDVTEDGVLDVVVLGYWSDVASAVDAGAVFVWSGGAGLTGSPLSPTFVLSGSVPGEQGARQFAIGDFTGDASLDIVTSTQTSKKLYVWKGPISASGEPDATWSY